MYDTHCFWRTLSFWKYATCVGFILASSWVSEVDGSGVVEVRVTSFSNPLSRLADGRCCDGYPEVCTSQCDHSFHVCLSDGTREKCQGGTETVNGPTDMDVLTSPLSTLSLHFESWRESIQVRVNVTDMDGDKEEDVDILRANLNAIVPANNKSVAQAAPHRFNISGHRKSNITSLELEVAVFCDPNYFGPRCDVHCFGDDGCSGHYTCNSTGGKNCLPGWEGPNCIKAISGGVADCSAHLANLTHRCLNGATCILLDFHTGYSFCCCAPGFRGGNCEIEITTPLTTTPTPSPTTQSSPASSSPMSSTSFAVISSQVTIQTNTTVWQVSSTLAVEHENQTVTTETMDTTTINQLGSSPERQMTSSMSTHPSTVPTTTVLYETSTEGHGLSSAMSESTSPLNISTNVTTSEQPSTSVRAEVSTLSSVSFPETTPSTEETTVAEQLNTTDTHQGQSTNITHPTTNNYNTQTTQPQWTSPQTSAYQFTAGELSTPQHSPSTEPTTVSEQLNTTDTHQAQSTNIRVNGTHSTTGNYHTQTAEPESTSPHATAYNFTKAVRSTEATAEVTQTHSKHSTQLLSTAQSTVQVTSAQTASSEEPTPPASTTLPATTATTVLTSQQPEVHKPSQWYNVLLYGTIEEFTDIQGAIKMAYVRVNKELTNSTITVNYTIQEALGENRDFIIEYSYTVTVNTSLSVEIYVPSMDVLRQTVLRLFQRRLYVGPVWYYLEDSFRLLVTGPPPATFQFTLLQAVLESAWDRSINSTCVTCAASVTVGKAEELVGPDGASVTRVYYFLSSNNTQLTPREGWSVTREYLPEAFLSHNLSLTLYTKEVHKLIRLRYHYSFAVEGHVYIESLSDMKTELLKVWLNKSEEWQHCDCLNLTLIRTERYVSTTGKVVTKIIYFVSVHKSVLSPMLVEGPSHSQLVSSVKVIYPARMSAEFYVLVDGSNLTLYRQDLQLFLYVKDIVDRKSLPVFIQRLEAVWSTKMEVLQQMTVVITTVSSCVGETKKDSQWQIGQEVSKLGYFVVNKQRQVFNAAWNKPVSEEEMVAHCRNITSTSGHIYEIYSQTSKTQVFTKEQHYSLHINGHVIIRDIERIAVLLQQTWETSYKVDKVNVSVTLTEEFYSTDTRQLVTGLWYALTVHGTMVDASVEYRTEFNTSHFEKLSVASGMKVALYHRVGALISYRYQLFVHFSQPIAELDYSKIEVALTSGWNRLHPGVTNIAVLVAGVDQFYTESMTVVWRVVYFVRRANAAVYPLHLPTIAGTDWVTCNCLKVTGISGTVYTLYTGRTTASSLWIPYSYHFSLDLQKEVSRLDYSRLEQTIKAAWSTHQSKGIQVRIVAQEEYLTSTGQSIWRIVYLLTRGSVFIKSEVIPSIYVRPLAPQTVDLSFVNIFGSHYSLSTIHTTLIRYSQAFSFISNFVIREENSQGFSLAIRDVVCGQIKEVLCSDLSPIILRQEEQPLATSFQWRVKYYLEYKGRVLNAKAWPHVDTKALQTAVQTRYNLTTLSGNSYVLQPTLAVGTLDYRKHFSLFVKTKVALEQLDKFAVSLKTTWLTTHAEYKSCGCVDVVVKNQEQLLTAEGETYWKLVYFITVNGTVRSPLDTVPVNYTLLAENIDFTGPRGRYVIVPTYEYNSLAYNYRYSNALYLQTWVSRTDYSRFEEAIKKYYMTRWSTKNPNVKAYVTGVRQVSTADGRAVWKLLYYVRVNDRLVYPTYLPVINYNHLHTMVTFKTPTGLEYSFYQGDVRQLITTESFFYFNLNYPITPSMWDFFRQKIALTLCHINKVEHCGLAKVELSRQQMEVISANRHTVWRVGFQLKVNGSTIDPLTSPRLDVTTLHKYLTSNVSRDFKYKVTEYTGREMLAQTTFSAYFNHYVSMESLEILKASLRQTWTAIYPELDVNRIDITFLQQKEYTDIKGNSGWKFDYTVNYNNTAVYSGDWKRLNTTLLQSHLAAVHTANGQIIRAVDTMGTTTLQYHQQFAVYSTAKVAVEDFMKIKAKLLLTWKTVRPDWKSCSCLDVVNVRQEEVIDSTGKSVWKILYTLMENGTAVDARMTDNLPTSTITDHLVVEGPRERYAFFVPSRLTEATYSRSELSISVTLNNKLDANSLESFQKIVTSAIAEKHKDITDTASISIQKQEEYIDKSGKTVWKVVCFVKQNNSYIPASTVVKINATDLSLRLTNITGPRGQTFEVVESTSLFEYRSQFSVYMASRVSVEQYGQFEAKLKESWEKTKTEYVNCSCVNVTVVGQEEVVDQKGVSYWKLVYALRVNHKAVEALTSVDVKADILQQSASSILRPNGEQYKVVEISETQVSRVTYTHAVYFTSQIGIFDLKVLQSKLEHYWIATNSDWSSCNCLEVSIIRQQSLNVLESDVWHRLWRIDYRLSVEKVSIDRQTVPVVNITQLQQSLVFTSSLGRQYHVAEVMSLEMVEERWLFPIYVVRQVAVTQMAEIEGIIEDVWQTTAETSETVKVSIAHQQEVVDIKGQSFWKLSVLIRHGSEYLDCSLHPAINSSVLEQRLQELNVSGARGPYDIVHFASNAKIHTYTALFSLFLNVHVYRQHLEPVERMIETCWHNLFKEHSMHLDESEAVTIVRQEDYLTEQGQTVVKVVYTISSNETSITSERVPAVNTTEVDILFQQSAITQRYLTVKGTGDVVRYEQHFQLTLTAPVLTADIRMFQSRLKAAWSASKNVSLHGVTITVRTQEEITAVVQTQRQSLWRVLYTADYEGSLVNALMETDIPTEKLLQSLSVTNDTSTVTYAHVIFTGRLESSVVYSHLFAVYFRQKVAQQSHTELAAKLEAAWKVSTGMSVSVSIVHQEKVYISKHFVWKLTYSALEGMVSLRRDMTPGPDMQTLEHSMHVMGPLGEVYQLVNVTSEGKRLAYSLSIFLTKRIRFFSQESFIKNLTAVWVGLHIKMSASDVHFDFRGYEEYLDHNSVSIWRQIIFVSVEGVLVNAAMYRHLNMSHVQMALDTTFGSSSSYRALDSAVVTSARDSSLRYSLTLKGRTRVTAETLLEPILDSWKAKYNQSSGNTTESKARFDAEIVAFQEGIGMNGETVTQVLYFVNLGKVTCDPLTVPAPVDRDIVARVDPTLRVWEYRGDLSAVYSYHKAFTVDLRGPPNVVSSDALSISLDNIFKSAHLAQLQIRVLKLEQFTGRYGVSITRALYSVSANDTTLDPDIMSNSLGDRIEDIPVSDWRIYRGTLHRLGVMYSLTLAGKVGKADKMGIETALTETYRYNNTATNISVSVVSSIESVSISGNRLTTLHYTLSVNDVQQKSYNGPKARMEILQQQLQTTVPKLSIWVDTAYRVETLYFNPSANLTEDILSQTLTDAWKPYLSGNGVEINVTVSEGYVADRWMPGIRVDYTVSDNGHPVSIDSPHPGAYQLKKVFLNYKIPNIHRQLWKLRKIYVHSLPADATEASVGGSLKGAWAENNPDVNNGSLVATVKPFISRRRRQASSVPKLVDKDGKDVRAVVYRVSVDGDEPPALFVEAPSPEMITAHLQADLGAGVCNCTPSLAHSIRVAGNVTDADKDNIKEAIKDAIVAANPDVKKKDLDVAITGVTTEPGEDGKSVSDVKYTVSHKGGLPMEDLTIPTEGQMEEALKNHGFNGPENTGKTPAKEDETWKIIVGVVVGVGGAIILSSILAYIYIRRRRRKNADIQERGKQIVRKNDYDKENFSEPVNFNNPSFDSTRHPLDPFSSHPSAE